MKDEKKRFEKVKTIVLRIFQQVKFYTSERKKILV